MQFGIGWLWNFATGNIHLVFTPRNFGESVKKLRYTKFRRLRWFRIGVNNFGRFWIHKVGGWTDGLRIRDLNFDIWIRSCHPGYFFSEPELNGSVILFIRSKFIQVKIYTGQNLYRSKFIRSKFILFIVEAYSHCAHCQVVLWRSHVIFEQLQLHYDKS
jgi:hypothetical protein